ncbi:MAG: AAA family ATPase, partial [Cyanobacteriota bacterium]|nr:AAA family ATPase [Cyanobacteriota bacterium]
IQSFELEIDSNGGRYKYELALEYEPQSAKFKIQNERLWFNGQPLLQFEQGEVQLYKDDDSEWSKYPFNSLQSVLSSIAPRADNKKIIGFKERLERFLIVKIIPSLMLDESNREESFLESSLSNYASWYRYLSQDQSNIFKLAETLKEVFEDFSYFKFEQIGTNKLAFKATFSRESGNSDYNFTQLSDGQRALIALYTLITCTESKDYTLCLDEPENFVALPEIQPWLIQLQNLCMEQKIQALLISHHPELMNMFTSSSSYWFERKNQSMPVRIKRVKDDQNTGLPISELIARGWLNDEA